MYWEVIGNHKQGVYKADLTSHLTPVMNQTGVIKFCVLLLSLILLLLKLLNLIGSNRKSYTWSLEAVRCYYIFRAVDVILNGYLRHLKLRSFHFSEVTSQKKYKNCNPTNVFLH